MTRRHHPLPCPLSRAKRAGAAAVCITAALGCDPNEDATDVQIDTRPSEGAGTAGRGAGGTGGASDTGDMGGASDTGGAGGTGGAAAAVERDAGSPVDRDVYRPEEVAATPELMARLRAPAGFVVRPFAEGMGQARMLVARGDHVSRGLTRATSCV